MDAPVKDLAWILAGVAAVILVITPLGVLTYLDRPTARPRRTRKPKRIHGSTDHDDPSVSP